MAKAIARKRAKDDATAMAEDLEQEGWTEFFALWHKPEGVRWTAARWAMGRAWRAWRFGIGQRRLGSGKSPIEAVDLDQIFTADLIYLEQRGADPFNTVMARELLHAAGRQIESRVRKPDIYFRILRAIVENGGPSFNDAGDFMRSRGIGAKHKERRIKKIQKIFNELTAA